MMRRLVRALSTWRRRTRGGRARVHRFLALSDRTLADIGLRRADVYAAAIGIVPLGGRATVPAPTAPICVISDARLTLVASDAGNAAAAPGCRCACAGATMLERNSRRVAPGLTTTVQ